MPEEPTHIIHKLVVEVETSTTRRGFELRDNAGKFVHERVVPAIEAYIKELEMQLQDGETIEMDKLVVNLDAPTIDFSDPSWNHRLSGALDASLAKVRNEIQQERLASGKLSTQPSLGKITSGTPLNEEFFATAESEEAVQGIRFESQSERALRAVFHFLKTGQRPWWIGTADTMNKLLEVKQLHMVVKKQLSLYKQLFQEQFTSVIVVDRWVKQLSDEQLILLLTHVAAEQSPKQSSNIQKTLFYKSHTSTIERKLREVFWKTVIATLVKPTEKEEEVLRWFRQQLITMIKWDVTSSPESGRKELKQLVKAIRLISGINTRISEEKVVSNFLESLNPAAETLNTTVVPENIGTLKTALLATDSESEPASTATDSSVEGAAKEKVPSEETNPNESKAAELDENRVERTETDSVEETVVSTNKLTDQNDDLLPKKEMESDWQPLQETNGEEEIIPESGIIIENAGLVILHPFLNYFFKDLNLVDEQDQLTDKDLAVHVLHYVATGKTADYEHAMLFEKYLVGLPLGAPITRTIEITTEIQEKTIKLLQAVRSNWGPLSGTSDAGIRETFLVREGKLILTEEWDRLVMEKKTVDILMEKLSWSVSMIHLPWKEGVLYVEW